MRFFLALMLVTGLCGEASACSCLVGGSLQTKFQNAEFVYVGQFISSENVDALDALDGRSGRVAKLQLQEVFKARMPPPPRVITGNGNGDCGVPIFPVVHYFIFAGPQGEVSICDGTRPFLSGDEGVKYFLNALRAWREDGSKDAQGLAGVPLEMDLGLDTMFLAAPVSEDWRRELIWRWQMRHSFR